MSAKTNDQNQIGSFLIWYLFALMGCRSTHREGVLKNSELSFLTLKGKYSGSWDQCDILAIRWSASFFSWKCGIKVNALGKDLPPLCALRLLGVFLCAVLSCVVSKLCNFFLLWIFWKFLFLVSRTLKIGWGGQALSDFVPCTQALPLCSQETYLSLYMYHSDFERYLERGISKCFRNMFNILLL